jgi:pyroglutamyl-peptidase
VRAVRVPPGAEVAGHEVVGRVLPVSTSRAPALLEQALAEVDPAVVLMLGVAPGRPALTIERVAVNVLDFEIPDNDGARPDGAPIVEGGPDAYLSTLPARSVVAAWREAGVPGCVSETAGTYLCNQALYTALHATAGRDVPVGFVHLPSLPEEAARADAPGPSMAVATVVAGVRAALAAVVPALAR